MLLSTCGAYWESTLTLLLPPVAALLSATALWVASKARSISQDAQSISQDHEALLPQLVGRPSRSASRSGAPARKRRSMKGIISTSRGR